MRRGPRPCALGGRGVGLCAPRAREHAQAGRPGHVGRTKGAGGPRAELSRAARGPGRPAGARGRVCSDGHGQAAVRAPCGNKFQEHRPLPPNAPPSAAPAFRHRSVYGPADTRSVLREQRLQPACPTRCPSWPLYAAFPSCRLQWSGCAMM